MQRREERIRAKWERARLEQEAIRQTRLEEAKEAEGKLAQAREVEAREIEARKAQARELEALKKEKLVLAEQASSPHELISHSAPVTPATLLTLPNSLSDLMTASLNGSLVSEKPAVADASIDVLGNPAVTDSVGQPNGSVHITENLRLINGSHDLSANGHALNGNKGSGDPETTSSSNSVTTGSDEVKTLKRQKSVRFSPNVESTTFKLSDPPSPNHSPVTAKEGGLLETGLLETNGDSAETLKESLSAASDALPVPAKSSEIVDQEHLQLMPEEAFFLSFGLGVLKIKDPSSGKTLSNSELLTLFRQYSYFPPRTEPDEPALRPDDNFLVHYAVYHHFRSLGWVPRGGIKFGVDWLLYTRGPVFDHAEFGLMVIPSYSDASWEHAEQKKPGKTWQWLHSTVRVLSHVTKSLVLVYVDIPPSSQFEAALENGITEALKLYKIREVMVKRWSSNRNR